MFKHKKIHKMKNKNIKNKIDDSLEIAKNWAEGAGKGRMGKSSQSSSSHTHQLVKLLRAPHSTPKYPTPNS